MTDPTHFRLLPTFNHTKLLFNPSVRAYKLQVTNPSPLLRHQYSLIDELVVNSSLIEVGSFSFFEIFL